MNAKQHALFKIEPDLGLAEMSVVADLLHTIGPVQEGKTLH